MINPSSAASESSLPEKIKTLKEKMNAVILAHYYQEGDIQDIADFIGDSLELARKAKTTDAEVIVFAGVHFMAETAKILNPKKLVLVPDMEAGCSLAESCQPEAFKKFREEHPDHTAITYINCSAEIKALSDIICTSSNAEKIINQIPEGKPIIFAPDKNLGRYLIKKTGREMLLWDGACIVHEAFSEERILKMKLEFPDAKLIAHPECVDSLLMHADFIGSTSKLLNYVKENDSETYIVATETGIIHQMQKAAPEKIFIPAPSSENCECNNCPYMKMNTLEKILKCMELRGPELVMSEELRVRALKPIERMLEMS